MTRTRVFSSSTLRCGISGISLRGVFFADQKDVGGDSEDEEQPDDLHRRFVSAGDLFEPACKDGSDDAGQVRGAILDSDDTPDSGTGNQRLGERPVVGGGQSEAAQREDGEDESNLLT